jgi:hypothetical protein
MVDRVFPLRFALELVLPLALVLFTSGDTIERAIVVFGKETRDA